MIEQVKPHTRSGKPVKGYSRPSRKVGKVVSIKKPKHVPYVARDKNGHILGWRMSKRK